MFFKSQSQKDAETRAMREQEAAEAAAHEAARLAEQQRLEQEAEEEERHRAKMDILGYAGAPADVFAAAESEETYLEDMDIILAGAMRAFREGHSENLQSFFAGYMSFQRRNGGLRDLERQSVGDDVNKLIIKPAMQLIESSSTPRETIVSLAGGMPPFYAQTFMDLCLRQAVFDNNAYICAQLLDLGADVNCYEGRPLWVAYNKDLMQVGAVLLKYNPDTKMTDLRQVEEGYEDDFKAFLKQAAAFPIPKSIVDSKLFAEAAKQMTEKKGKKEKTAEPAPAEPPAKKTAKMQV